MTKPTREQIERLSSLLGVIMEPVIVDVDGRLAEEIISDVLACYLAQQEELRLEKLSFEVSDERNQRIEGENFSLIKKVAALEAENQELKRKGELLCCQAGVLEMENQELKAELLRLEA